MLMNLGQRDEPCFISSTDTGKTQWPSRQVKTTVMFLLLFTIILMTIGCLVTLLTSTSSRTVTYSIDKSLSRCPRWAHMLYSGLAARHTRQARGGLRWQGHAL